MSMQPLNIKKVVCLVGFCFWCRAKPLSTAEHCFPWVASYSREVELREIYLVYLRMRSGSKLPTVTAGAGCRAHCWVVDSGGCAGTRSLYVAVAGGAVGGSGGGCTIARSATSGATAEPSMRFCRRFFR